MSLSNSKSILSVKNLCISYARQLVLSDIDLEMTQGEIVCVLGPNGGGKSSLLKSIAGIIPAQGEICIFGKPLGSWSRKEIAQRVSYVPQFLETTSSFTVMDYVLTAMYASLFEDQKRIALESMELCHCLELRDRSVSTLSGGERQRVLFAAAIAQGGDLLLLDEPFASMDLDRTLEFLGLLSRLRAEGKSMLVVVHDLNWATSVADRILYLKNGARGFLGSSSEFLKEDVLRKILGDRFSLVPNPGGELPIVVPRFSDE